MTNYTYETELEREVAQWINDQAEEYDSGAEGVMSDLMQGGCESGLVSGMIYYTDTVKFYKRHKSEIQDMLKELCSDFGCTPQGLFGDKWDDEDFFCEDTHNQNLLAWFGFEETARRLASSNGIEV